MKPLRVVFVLAVVAIGLGAHEVEARRHPAPATAGIPLSSYKLTFDDEFNALSIGADGPVQGKNWTDHLWYHGSAGGVDSWEPVDGPTNPFSVNNGILSITAHRNPNPGKYSWMSGGIVSVDDRGHGFSQTYGYFEMRALLPGGSGEWPAFFMLNLAHEVNNAPQAEIDIIEAQGNTPDQAYTTIHTTDPAFNGAHAAHPEVMHGISGFRNSDNTHEIPGLQGAFHTYSVSWTPSTITFYVDRTALTSMPTPADMHSPMFMIANLDIGGWTGGADATTPDPSVMQIDYIRAYSSDPKAVAVGPNPETGGFAP